MPELSPMHDLTRQESLQVYRIAMEDRDRATLRKLCRTDLFFLLAIAMHRADVQKEDWLYARCREVEADPDGYLDLWAREHYKSTIITFALTIQDVLCDSSLTVGLFSCTRPLAKDFLGMIKVELEKNEFLKELFPDILWANPEREAPSWSLDNGLIVKRKSNSREATFEAWGLVEGMPTGKHFRLLVYDDVITERHVTSPDMIRKVTQAWELSLNLGARGGRERYVGTRYHYNDTYRVILERGAAVPRIRAATDDGTPDGNPVFLTREELRKKRASQGPYVFACQQLQDPTADERQGFHADWLRYYSQNDDKACKPGWNYYLLCDPAGEKKKENDYTVMVVIAAAPDQNYYLVDAIRDRMNLAEKTSALFRLHRKYMPRAVGYEKYGMQSDIEAMEREMDRENYRFTITPLGGATAKNDRIKKLVPIFEQGRFYIPYRLLFTTVEGKVVDFTRCFIEEEYERFPLAIHDDMFDCIARIVDKNMGLIFPQESANVPMRRGGQHGNVPMAYDEYSDENYDVYAS